ncbi:MAG: hypothetical protein ABIR92_12165, partial [Gemmatimonadaceae bacterium]
IGFFALTCMTMAGSCDSKREDPATITRLTADGNVIVDSTPAQALKYSLDGEKYGKWVVAQRELDAIPNLSIPTRVSLNRFTDDDVKYSADWLDNHDRARLALKSADISARDYVLTSVALEQLVASMRTSGPIRFRELPPGNAEFIGQQSGFRQTFDARRVRVVGDGTGDARDSDARDSDGKDSDAKDSDGKDSDGKDSDARKGKRGKAKGKNKG